MKQDCILIEILTEELPPKALRSLEEAFCASMTDMLKKARFVFSKIESFATPRRLALLISDIDGKQPDQVTLKRGPAWKSAFDTDGSPTKACEGFAKSCGVHIKELKELKTEE